MPTNRRLRGAIVGFGHVAELGHWPTYAKSEEVEISAVVDPSAERREAARQQRAGLHLYSSLEELFAKETVDFVDICTPPAAHVHLARVALARGCHVLCEKPLALSAED